MPGDRPRGARADGDAARTAGAKIARGGVGLADVQGQLYDLITAPEGVARRLGELGRGARDLETIVRSSGPLSAVERVDVYANMYFFRILEVLHADYPKLRAVVRDDAFHNLATAYLAAHPSRHPSLRFVGAKLPGFVATSDVARARPWLADLAALEWARVDVFDRADVTPLPREALAATPPEAFASIRLATIAAFELVPVTFAVAAPWRALETRTDDVDEAKLDDPPRAAPGAAIVVWRRGVTVHHRPADAREAQALALVRAGTTFGTLCTSLGESTASEEEAAQVAAGFLGAWLAEDLLASGS
jgi:hypothetical protein